MANYKKNFGIFSTSKEFQTFIVESLHNGKTNKEMAAIAKVSTGTIRRRRKAALNGEDYEYIDRRGQRKNEKSEAIPMKKFNSLWRIQSENRAEI